MNIRPFALERYFSRYEFASRYLLSSSDCDGLPMREVLALADDEARALWDGLTLGYTESLGLPLLREAVAETYCGVDPSQVLIAAPEEAVFIAMNSLLHAGDHVVCTFPGYQSLYEIAIAIGCEVSSWQPHEDQGWRFDPADLAATLRTDTRLVVTNFPHNPTGYLPSPDEWQAMLDTVACAGCYLFADEMYRGLEIGSARRLPAAVEVYERAISLSGMSKTMGMAGVRLGWLVTADRPLLAQMAVLKDYTTICSAAPSEMLSLIALRARRPILARHVARITRNVSVVDAFMRQHSEHLSWVPPVAGTVCFPRLAHGGAEALCASAAAEGLMILPSTVFAYGDEHIRLGLGRENLPAALAELERYLAVHAGA